MASETQASQGRRERPYRGVRARPRTPRGAAVSPPLPESGLRDTALTRGALEQELARPEGDPVTVFQGMLLRQLPVDERAVRRAEIDQRPPTRVAPQLGVPPAHVRIGQNHVAARQTSDHYGLTSDGDALLRLAVVAENHE